MAKSKAQTKKSASSTSKSGGKSAGKTSAKKSAGSSASGKSTSAKRSGGADHEWGAQVSFDKAKDFVGKKATLPTAGLALAGAGVLALVSTQAGRNLVKAAAEAVISLVNSPKVTDSISATLKPFKSDKQNSKTT